MMSAFIQARSAFSSGVDFNTNFEFDMSSRKHSNLEDYGCSTSYPMFNDEQQTKQGDTYRSYQQQQHHTSPNHFTLNQSITHVNLINNRFQIDLPSHHAYNSSHDYPNTDSMNQPHMPPVCMNPSNMNNYYKSDMSPSRINPHVYTQSNNVDGYPSPPALINSSSSEQFMNFPSSQQNYPLRNVDDFQSMHSFNKFSMSDHSFSLPNPTPLHCRLKPESDYSTGFFTENILSGNNSGLPSSIIQQSLNNNKIPSIFSPQNLPKQRDTDVEQVSETQKCKNTIEGTKTSVRRFKRWYKEKYNKEIDMNSVNRFNAPELLKDFFLDIRDTRPGRVGNEYEPVTLTTYRNGLRRYFLYRKMPPAPDNFDLTDKSFDIVNRHLVTKRDDLKRKGKGNHPNAIESITPEQLEKMWASGAIGTHAPRPLLRLQWWYNTVYHGVRGRMAHHDLSTDDFTIRRAGDGKLIMEYNKNLTMNHNPLSPKLEPVKKKKFKGAVKETDGGERDPIRAFELYKAHRPAGISSFYLTPKHKPKGSVWFNKVPMGKNSIGRIMREIKQIAGI